MTYTQMPYRPKPVRPRRWPYIVAAVIGGLVLLTITLAIAASSIPERTKAAAPAPTFNAGTYKVGATVPAGTYKVSCGPGNKWGYYFLRGSSSPSDGKRRPWCSGRPCLRQGRPAHPGLWQAVLIYSRSRLTPDTKKRPPTHVGGRFFVFRLVARR